MTITSSNNRDQYTGNGANTAFTYTFKIFDEDDIQVYAGDTLQTITTHYTVSGVGNPAGGTVTFLVAPANGVIVTLVLDEPFTQEIDYVDGDDFPASAHEEGLDRSVSRDLTLSERISRSLLLPPETTITDLELPTPVADNVLGWNGAATALENKVAATSYLPSPTPAGSMLRVNSGLTGYELRTPTQVRGDISAAVSGANTDITSLTGTTTNDNAAAGKIGEYISSGVVAGSAVSLTTGTAANITSISLTAGDWDVRGVVCFSPATTTTSGFQTAGINTTSATIPTTGLENNIGGSTNTGGAGVYGAGIGTFATVGPTRISIAGTTTVYLVARSAFSISTMTAHGFIGARRVR